MDVDYLKFSLLLVQLTVLWGVLIKENNPEFCRCGEAKQGKIERPRDIQVFFFMILLYKNSNHRSFSLFSSFSFCVQEIVSTTSAPTTTTNPEIDLGEFGVAIVDRKLSVKAIGSHSVIKKAKEIVENQQEITEMYSPFTPNNRPWLVIIEVNMTDQTRNTECTGKLLILV